MKMLVLILATLASINAFAAKGGDVGSMQTTSKAHPYKNGQDAVVLPIGYGGAPNSLAFMKIAGQTARDLYDSIASVAAGHPGSASLDTRSNGDTFTSTITTADKSAQCTKSDELDAQKETVVNYYYCTLWIQPLSK